MDEIKNGVHVLYKKLGETPLEAVLRFKKENQQFEAVPVTYAGRLDPMAEGVLLVLSGEQVHNKEKFLDLPKEYEAEILWGFQTDTLDLLGLITEEPFSKNLSQNFSPNTDLLKKYLAQLVGKFEQTYPLYSSRPVGGKSLFQWAREGKADQIQIPKHEVEIYKSEYLSRRTISKEDLLAEIQRKVGLVKGDFRQEETIAKWREVMSKMPFDMFTLDKISIVVSSGFYVRQLVSDLAAEMGTNAVTFSIKRTKVGDYC